MARSARKEGLPPLNYAILSRRRKVGLAYVRFEIRTTLCRNVLEPGANQSTGMVLGKQSCSCYSANRLLNLERFKFMKCFVW